MAKQKKLFVILSGVVFLALCAALLAACFFARPLALKRTEISKAKTLRENISAVLPAFDNEPWNESFLVQGTRVFPARREEKVSLPGDLSGLPEHEPQMVTVNVLKGFAFEVSALDGEGLDPVWVGFDTEGGLTGHRPALFRDARVPENFTRAAAPQTRASLNISEAVKDGKELFETYRNFFIAQAHEAQMSGETL